MVFRDPCFKRGIQIISSSLFVSLINRADTYSLDLSGYSTIFISYSSRTSLMGRRVHIIISWNVVTGSV